MGEQYFPDYKKPRNQFKDQNVMGIPGHVFGVHWHQRSGPIVNPSGHPDWACDVKIRWVTEAENRYPDSLERPAIFAHGGDWSRFRSNLHEVEQGCNFRIREHCRNLVVDAQTKHRMPVVLEWGCGAGCAVHDLTNEPGVRQLALVFGYGDIWDVHWNEIRGVKFLFFVKEHLAEYFRRKRLQIDFIYTYGAMDYLKGEEFIAHLRDLATVMHRGGLIVFSLTVRKRAEFDKVADIFEQSPGCSQNYNEGDPSYLVRR